MTRILTVCAVVALGVAACMAASSADPHAVTVARILAGSAGEDGTVVLLVGRFQGWRPGPGGPATQQGPPVTRSDWALDDGTGSIYVTGAAPTLDPTRDMGQSVRVTGTLRHTKDGRPYLEATRAERP